MTSYSIANKTSGAILGVYQGDDAAAALDAMADDAGYEDYRDMIFARNDTWNFSEADLDEMVEAALLGLVFTEV